MAFNTVATWKLTKWTGSDLIRRLPPAILTEYGKVLDQQLKEEIKAVEYSWPRETRRKNKSVVTSPRDIVDLGGFLRSQDRQRINPTSLKFVWSTPYAALILNGYTTNRGAVVPPRNWIKPALDKLPFDDFVRQQWAILSTKKL